DLGEPAAPIHDEDEEEKLVSAVAGVQREKDLPSESEEPRDRIRDGSRLGEEELRDRLGSPRHHSARPRSWPGRTPGSVPAGDDQAGAGVELADDLGNLFRGVLEVRVHYDEKLASSGLDSLTLGSEGGLLPLVEDRSDPRLAVTDLGDQLPRSVGAPVVHDQDLERGEGESQDLGEELAEVVSLVQR